MKFDLSSAPGLNTFTGYGEGYVLVNGRRHAESLIVLAERVLPWPVPAFDALEEPHFAILLECRPEIVLVGTGAKLRFPHPRLMRAFGPARIGLEVMDTQAACRTYNILVAEGRRVAAALILDRAAPGA